MDIIVENKRLSGTIKGISSKSYAQRALFLSLLAKGTSKIHLENLSEDIGVALEITKNLANIEENNKTYTISPKHSIKNLDLDAGESGTSLRLIIPILGALGIESKITRQGSLVGRTIDIYKDLLPSHGLEIKEEGPDILIKGRLKAGSYDLPGNVSSQFISGLLIALGFLKEKSHIRITTEIESQPYIDMTMEIMEVFGQKVEVKDKTYIIGGGYKGAEYTVEGDWSSALFFLCAGCEVLGLNKNSLQADRMAVDYLYNLGFRNVSKNGIRLEKIHSSPEKRLIDASNMPDSIPILSLLSALIPGQTTVINTSRLRLKESDRVKSTCQMLENLGVKVAIEEESFTFSSVDSFKSSTLNSFNDHRITMSASIGGTFADGYVKILGADSVNKSYPGFYKDFEDLGGIYHVQ